MKEFFVYLLVFVAGGVVGIVAEYFILRNNPKIVKKLEEELANVKAEAARYRQAYEDLVRKIKEKTGEG